MPNKKLAIHQPNFLPWIGYFHKIINVDEFVLFDDVQFPRGKSFGNRVLIKTGDDSSWLTVPVKSKSDLLDFKEIEIDYQSNWSRKILKTILLTYKKQPGFDFLYPELEIHFEKKYQYLIELNISLIKLCHSKLSSDTTFIRSSEIQGAHNLNGTDKILFILNSRQAKSYLSGSGAGSKRYLDEGLFSKNDIEVQWQKLKADYSYPQGGNGFIPNLSIIDLIFNCGAESGKILKEL
jgi:hypothetical protein